MSRRCATAVILTLAYTHQFEYPLSATQIHRRLLGKHRYSYQQVMETLQKLHELGLVTPQAGWWSLATAGDWAEQRLARLKIAAQKWQDAMFGVRMLKHIPWIQAVFVSGSLAMNNTDDLADVDFLVVTSPGRLWITRPVVTLLAMVLGKRRSWRQEEHQSWCFNAWVEETDLAVFAQDTRRNLYTAHELLQARCVFDRSRVHDRLLAENSWIQQFFAGVSVKKSSVCQANHTPVWGMVVTLFNNVLFWMQQIYMKPHQTSEEVTYTRAMFHPRPTQSIVLANIQRDLTELREFLQ